MITILWGASELFFIILLIFLITIFASLTKKTGKYILSQAKNVAKVLDRDIKSEFRLEGELDKDIKTEIKEEKEIKTIFDYIFTEVKKAVNEFNKGNAKGCIKHVDNAIIFTRNAKRWINYLINTEKEEERIIKKEESENVREIKEAKVEEKVDDKKIREIAKKEEKIDKTELKQEKTLEKIEKNEISCLDNMKSCINSIERILENLKEKLERGDVKSAQNLINNFKKEIKKLRNLHNRYLKLFKKEEKVVMKLDRELKEESKLGKVEEKLLSKLRNRKKLRI